MRSVRLEAPGDTCRSCSLLCSILPTVESYSWSELERNYEATSEECTDISPTDKKIHCAEVVNNQFDILNFY